MLSACGGICLSKGKITVKQINFYVCNYIAIFVKTLKILVSNFQNLQNAKFSSRQIKYIYIYICLNSQLGKIWKLMSPS